MGANVAEGAFTLFRRICPSSEIPRKNAIVPLMELPNTRRTLLGLIAATPLLVAERGFAAVGKTASIGNLIQKANTLPHVSERVDFIARSLLGTRYQGNTLVGGPNLQEQFVFRDDAFDCVTYCEVVLAAAIAREIGAFETSLRRIRYNHGNVQWRERNHYFADWNQRNIENRICQPVPMEPSVSLKKTVNWHKALGPHTVSIDGIPPSTFFANKQLLKAGDIIGFTSRQPNLDFFHTGFVAFGSGGTLLLRHASQSRGRVMDDDIAGFFNVNMVKYVTLVRAMETPPQ